VIRWTASTADAGVRLDKFLASPDRLGSRRKVSLSLERGQVFLNDTEASIAEAGTRLAAGDVVGVWRDRPGSASRRKPKSVGELAVIYQDASLIVVNKPPGLLSVPLASRAAAASAYLLVETYLRAQGHRQRPHVVHRIDRDTSGLVMFAKTAAAYEQLNRQFRRHEAERVYQAVVYGAVQPPSGAWRDQLVWDQAALIQRKAHPKDRRGSEAVSYYQTLEPLDGATLLEVRLETGKRNQIRLQAGLRGHPLIGEKTYDFGAPPRPIAFERQALHAWRLACRHPIDDRLLRFEAAPPSDFLGLVERLRRPTARS
jgi:23S rRNA pseudouridine1911/1915/1917 synthase